MTRRNISHTHDSLVSRDETEQVYLDGDSSEAIFRALVDGDVCRDGVPDEFEAFVEEELDVEVEKTKWVGFGMEVTLR